MEDGGSPRPSDARGNTAAAFQAGLTPPDLVVLHSEYRDFFGPFLSFLRDLSAREPDRSIAVLVPEVVRRRWYHFFIQTRATLLKALLLLEGGQQISIINTPWYLHDDEEGVVSRPNPLRLRRAAAAQRAGA